MKILKDFLSFLRDPSILYFAMGMNVALFLLFFMLGSTDMMFLALGSGLLCYLSVMLNEKNEEDE